MKMLTTLRASAFATLAGAAISLPALAQANDYNRGYYDPGQKCRSQENDAQLIGGLLGAVVGGVAGSELSGNGARTEGSIIGVVLGGIAGAAIGDESVDCDKKRRARYRNTSYNGQTYGRRGPIVYDRTIRTGRVYQPTRRMSHNYGYRNNGYRYDDYNNGGYNRVNEIRAQLNDVRYRLHELREKDRRLERRLRRDYRPRLAQKQEWVHKEVHRLERKERRLRKRLRNQRQYY